ncbi:hypothetical protein TRAPUB_13760 [Trametes pubescens]|uniref:Uncharacterized protein n=1 Tax=Trametes pubescens TaxID=154538 RepID=A0A1M2VQC1_TRAPU|nr:hypothetical protein TRAPUB_13760 [Trametes pubescens]
MTRPPVYPAPHIRAATDVHAVTPPSVQPNHCYRPPRSHERFQQRPYLPPAPSHMATPPKPESVGAKQAFAPSRHYDTRHHYHDARFQPYPRPIPRFLNENEQDLDTCILPPDGSARDQLEQAGDDAHQVHTFERHDVELRGYDGRPFALSQPDRGAAFEVGTVYPSYASTSTGKVIYPRSLGNPIVNDPTPYGASRPPEQRARIRVDAGALHSPSYLAAAYPETYNSSTNPGAASHCARAASTPPFVTATDAPHRVVEAVNTGLVHTPIEPPLPIQFSTVQQQACPTPPPDRPTSPRQFRWVLSEPDDLHATAYYRLSIIDSEHEISLQKDQISDHDVDILAPKQAVFGYPDAKLYPQDAHVPDLSASRVRACNPDPHRVSGVPATGRRSDHPKLTVESSMHNNRQGANGELSHNTIPVQKTPPARGSPLCIEQAGGAHVHPAPYPTQTSQYQGIALCSHSTIVTGGAVMTCPVPLKLGRASAVSPIHERGYDSTGSLCDYSVQEHEPSPNRRLPYTFPRGTFTQPLPHISQLQMANFSVDIPHD